ncbi:putative acetyltransferase [compost metagenome]
MMISKADPSDLKEILELQYMSYKSEAEIYKDDRIPPLTQTIEELEQEYENHMILKAVIDGCIVGSVRAVEENLTCHIGKLIVNPNYQNQGIGTKLIESIEELFNPIKKFELFTGHKSERNLYLYKKLGYKPFKSVVVNDNLILIFMNKEL